MISTALTHTEETELAEHEAAIEQSKSDIGGRLKAIRDKKLYRLAHKTFESYLDERWGISRTRGYELIDVADVTENVRKSGQNLPAPKAAHARELAKLPKEEQVPAWEKSCETTATVTTKTVKGVVEQRKAEKQKESPPASIVLDAIKREVPENLRDKYAVGTELAAMGRKVDQVKRDIGQFAGADGAVFLSIQAVELAIKEVKDLITQAAYWTACPRCNGKGCSRCDKSGFIPKSRKGTLSHEDKELLGL